MRPICLASFLNRFFKGEFLEAERSGFELNRMVEWSVGGRRRRRRRRVRLLTRMLEIFVLIGGESLILR